MLRFYTYTAIYLTTVHTFEVCALDDRTAKERARSKANRALFLILRAITD